MSDSTKVVDGVDKAAFVEPFRQAYTSDERVSVESETLTIRINREERELIDWLRHHLNYDQDAKVIKTSLYISKNVLHGLLGETLVKRLTEGGRRRPAGNFGKKFNDFDKM